jgi:hypothetical protein
MAKKTLLAIALLFGPTHGPLQALNRKAQSNLYAALNAPLTALVEHYIKESNDAAFNAACSTARVNTSATIATMFSSKKTLPFHSSCLFLLNDYVGIYAPELRDLYKAIKYKTLKNHITSNWSKRIIAAGLLKAIIPFFKIGLIAD